MDDAKQQLIDKLKTANNILVTVSRDPSVDQLASCIGLTLLLNKQGKHAAAVFSGKVPSTLEFLQPDETLEKNTDSLRDFIISLDKSKADKLRYKVEEDVVRIFITPYKTSLSEDDLEFSEGDFNVDVVIALGVQKQEDLDQAITAHGRILHDATVTSINTGADGGLGTINWRDPQASSLSELVTDLADALDSKLLDAQIATALLTGIVSETGRFSNDRTSSQTMSASALLLSAGANQQLVASKLEAKTEDNQPSGNDAPDDSDNNQGEPDKSDDYGVLEINHATEAHAENEPPAPSDNDNPTPSDPVNPPPEPAAPENPPADPASNLSHGSKLVTEPPSLGGTLTANSQSERLDPVTDPLSLPQNEPPQPLASPAGSSHITPPPPGWTPPASNIPPPSPFPAVNDADDVTLTELEKSVGSPHVNPGELASARDEVNDALSGIESTEPIKALNAQPFAGDLHAPQPQTPPAASAPSPPSTPPATGPTASPAPEPQANGDSNAPPPVPPPIPFQFGNSPPPSQ